MCAVLADGGTLWRLVLVKVGWGLAFRVAGGVGFGRGGVCEVLFMKVPLVNAVGPRLTVTGGLVRGGYAISFVGSGVVGGRIGSVGTGLVPLEGFPGTGCGVCCREGLCVSTCGATLYIIGGCSLVVCSS